MKKLFFYNRPLFASALIFATLLCLVFYYSLEYSNQEDFIVRNIDNFNKKALTGGELVSIIREEFPENNKISVEEVYEHFLSKYSGLKDLVCEKCIGENDYDLFKKRTVELIKQMELQGLTHQQIQNFVDIKKMSTEN